MTDRILICDDEDLVRWSLREHFERSGFAVVEASDGEQCLEVFDAEFPDLLILDLRMPKLNGIDVLRTLRAKGINTPVIILTANEDLSAVIEATQLGAVNYLTKPFDLEAVERAAKRALDTLHQGVNLDGNDEPANYGGAIGSSAAMQAVFEILRSLQSIDAPTVLIGGESGTGKDVAARAIHATGPRADHPFVEVDCAAIPETLLESTLFGHERGAFTDAKARHVGLFETAKSGVVFLDEIGEMSMAMQAKLLRSLESRRFKRVGGTQDIQLTASLIAATNRDLHAEVAAGRFREDLYYRLAVIPIQLPPLRARGEDVRLLCEHFVARFNKQFERSIARISGPAMQLLSDYTWPGNIRELRNAVERMVIFQTGEEIGVDDVPPNIRYAAQASTAGCPFILPDEGVSLDLVERGLVAQALDRCEQNQTAAAKLLGLSRFALRTRMKKYEMN